MELRFLRDTDRRGVDFVVLRGVSCSSCSTSRALVRWIAIWPLIHAMCGAAGEFAPTAHRVRFRAASPLGRVAREEVMIVHQTVGVLPCATWIAPRSVSGSESFGRT